MPNTAADPRARDIMTPEPLCVPDSMTLRELTRTLADNEISGAPVVDAQGRAIGIVSQTDLLRRCMGGTAEIPPAYFLEVLSEQRDDEDEVVDLAPDEPITVADFMTEDPITVSPEAPASAVAHRMTEHRVHRVIVVDEERIPVGIITSLDLLGVIAAQHEHATRRP